MRYLVFIALKTNDEVIHYSSSLAPGYLPRYTNYPPLGMAR